MLLGLLWLLEGTNGVRHMMIVGAPMLAFGFIRLIKALNAWGWKKALLRTDAFRLCLILLGSCLCFLAGYALYPQLTELFGIEQTQSTAFHPDFQPEQFTKVLNDWLAASGVRFSDKSLLSLRGIALATALFSAIYGLARSFAKGEESTGKAMLRSLLGLSTVINSVILLLEGKYRFCELYVVPVLAMLFPLLAVELDGPKKAGQRALCLLCCLCLVFSGAYTALFMRTKDQTMDRWSGMSYSDMDTAQAAQECADFMLAEGYTHALIEYWYASTVMEAGNGRLAVAPLSLSYATDSDQQSRVSIYAWGTDTSPFLPENLPEELVVFVEWEEDLPTFLDRFPDAELVWESSPFSACVIPKDMLTQP